MKNILLLCCLFSFQAFAYEKHCENENATVIARLEKELDDCKGNYDVVSSEALIQAHRASARCMIDVADKLFDNFYVKNNKQVKAHFKNLTKSIYDCFYDNMLASDFAAENHMAAVYSESAEAEATYYIREAVRKYIHNIKAECEEKSF